MTTMAHERQATPAGNPAVEVDTLARLAEHAGAEFGPSAWVLVDQDLVDRFAHLTGDTSWYHRDGERAAQELPGGRPIAHGLLTLSLVPGLSMQLVKVRRSVRALNYGLDRVRFPAPVPVGSRLRLRMKVESATPSRGGILLSRLYTMELEGSPKPALSATMGTLVYPS